MRQSWHLGIMPVRNIKYLVVGETEAKEREIKEAKRDKKK